MSDVQQRVEEMFVDRAGVPWEVPPGGLRERTLAALAETQRRPLIFHKRVWVPLTAAACAVLATGTVVLLRGEGEPALRADVKLDPGRLLAPALSRLASSAEQSFSSDAKELLEDTKGLTRRVLAQLPFTGGR